MIPASALSSGSVCRQRPVPNRRNPREESFTALQSGTGQCVRINARRGAAGPDVAAGARSVATSATTSTTTPSSINPLHMSVVQAIFKNDTLFNLAQKQARAMIKKRAERIGIDWEGSMREYAAQDWAALMADVTDPSITYPAYYTQPFHAYPQGNLSWDAAKEVTMAAKAVHALVFDPDNKALDVEGDRKMRRSFNARTRECMAQLGGSPDGVRAIVDLGASSGLSSMALLEAFPGAEVTAVDLSPHFLAMATYEQRKREAATGVRERLAFLHRNIEATGLPPSSADLVSACLLLHELPAEVSKSVFREAFRLLKPGGCLAIMEIEPTAPAVLRVMANPMAYAAFKATEPWLEEYVALDVHGALTAAGFATSMQEMCTCRHRTIVAYKAA